jgi:ankyrin repeat protein
MKAMSGLNRKDFVIAYSSLDIIFASITMTMSDKDVLAARNLVRTSMAIEVFAMVIQGISISNLSRFDQQCLTGLTHPVLASPRGFVWALWTTRNFAVCSLIPTILRVSSELNLYEHDSREYPRGLRAKTWHYLSTTLFTHYLLYFSIVFLQGVPVILLASSDISKSWGALWSEWGQSAALIVTGVACTHAGYTFFRLRKRVPLGYTPIESAEYCSPDELLTNHSLIGPDAQSLRQLNLEKQNTLWKEWILSVDLGDRRGMLECLQQGLSRDRSFAEEHPIHMAARFNYVDIIDEAYSNHKDEEQRCYERLCHPNQLKQTPLLIAYKGRNFAAMETLLRMHHRYLDSSTSNEPHGSKYAQNVTADLSKILQDAIEKEDLQTLDLIIIKETVRQWGDIAIPNSENGACLYALLQNKIEAAKFMLPRSEQPLFRHPADHASYIKKQNPLSLYSTILRHFPSFWTDDKSVSHAIRTSVNLETVCQVAMTMGSVEVMDLLAHTTSDLPQYFLDFALTTPSYLKIGDELRGQLIAIGGNDLKSIVTAIKNVEVNKLYSQLDIAQTDGKLPSILDAVVHYKGLLCQPLSLILQIWPAKVSSEELHGFIKFMMRGGILNAPVPYQCFFAAEYDDMQRQTLTCRVGFVP